MSQSTTRLYPSQLRGSKFKVHPSLVAPTVQMHSGHQRDPAPHFVKLIHDMGEASSAADYEQLS
ncbi:hypothetical protein PspLS_09313 [Pyricularia sp. CBS 133598]|nr:hypothetical protein PspLS_09313 [Pyricularia sp. CBS 133598]